jgi:hypothetical protein
MKAQSSQPAGNQDLRHPDIEVIPTLRPGGKIPTLADKRIISQFPATISALEHMRGDGPRLDASKDANTSLLELRSKECICRDKHQPQFQDYVCSNPKCLAKVHGCCISSKRLEYGDIECTKCTILNNDPLTEIKKRLVEPSVLESKHRYNFYLDVKEFGEIQRDRQGNYDIEIRCIKLDGEHFFEQTWPDKCEILFNDKPVKEIQPLARNSSLKKRKDEKLRDLLKEVSMGTNSVVINYENVFDSKNSKSDQTPIYAFTVLLIKKLQPAQLFEKIKTLNYQHEHETRKQISEELFENREIKISEVKIELTVGDSVVISSASISRVSWTL